MHVDDRIPLLLGHVGQHAIAQDSGVVDHRVQVAERLDRGVDQPLRTFPRGDTVSVGNGIATHRLDLLNDLFGRAEIAASAIDVAAKVVDHDLRAVGSQTEGMFAPDPSTGSGHDCNSALTQLAHEFPSATSWMRGIIKWYPCATASRPRG